jgi:hypothetical protein
LPEIRGIQKFFWFFQHTLPNSWCSKPRLRASRCGKPEWQASQCGKQKVRAGRCGKKKMRAGRCGKLMWRAGPALNVVRACCERFSQRKFCRLARFNRSLHWLAPCNGFPHRLAGLIFFHTGRRCKEIFHTGRRGSEIFHTGWRAILFCPV